jgi:hypothetical protein
MMGTIGEEYKLIYQKIIKLQESELRNLVINVFDRDANLVQLTHGAVEYGADIILEIPKYTDLIGRSQIFLFQVKAQDIDMADWRKSINGQLTQMYCRPYMQLGVDEMAPRRLILITSRSIKESVKQAIHHWNSKLPIPIEAFDGTKFSHLLDQKYSIKASEIDELIQPRDRAVL